MLLFELDIYQALGTHLRTLHEVHQAVELLAGVVGTTRSADGADVISLVEHGESAGALEHIVHLDKGHAEATVGLVAAVQAHSLVPCHLVELFGQVYIAHLLEQVACQTLEHLEHILLIDKAHLAVDLGERRSSSRKHLAIWK